MFLKALFTATVILFAESASAQPVMSSEPPPGQLGAGQVVYVSCGPGKARKITGGSNMGIGSNGQPVAARSGSQRTRGPCVPMKGA
jgi:hypothetical protein